MNMNLSSWAFFVWCLQMSVSGKNYHDGYYEGGLLNGKRHGSGLMRYNSGYIYDGEWSNDTKHGKGAFIWPDGTKYVGKFVGGSFMGGDGEGTYFRGHNRCEAVWVSLLSELPRVETIDHSSSDLQPATTDKVAAFSAALIQNACSMTYSNDFVAEN